MSDTCKQCKAYIEALRAIADNYRIRATACQTRGWTDMADSCLNMATIIDGMTTMPAGNARHHAEAGRPIA